MNGEPRAIDAGEGAVWVAERSPTGADNLRRDRSAQRRGRRASGRAGGDQRHPRCDGAVGPRPPRPDPHQGEPGHARADRARPAVGRDARRLAVAAGYVWVTDYGETP